jgi:hypothetical protein
MFLSLAQAFKTLFIKFALTEVKAQSKRIRKSNEKANAAFEAAERYAEDQKNKRSESAGRIDEANKLMKE